MHRVSNWDIIAYSNGTEYIKAAKGVIFESKN